MGAYLLRVGFVALTTLALAGGRPALGAATRTVANLNDSGDGSLRATIAAAAAGDTINFGVTGTIYLTSGELVIDKNLDIYGPTGGGVTVQRSLAGATPNFRVFNITAGTVNILYLTIANGNVTGYGGGVLSAGSLTLFGCVLSGNKATIAGGALSASGPTTVSACAVWGNSAPAGGGVYNDGTTIINNSTFFANAAEAIENGAGTLTLLHCTISGNTNGVWNAQLVQAAQVELNNTVIAGNTDPNGIDVSGPLLSLGFNLIGRTNNPQGAVAWQSSDLTGSSAVPLDARLGPFQNNGGVTPSMALLQGSPALDAGTGGGFVTDQRSFARPHDLPWIVNAPGGDGSDIGALEMNAANRVVTTLNDSGTGSLRSAISIASPYEGDRITFAANVVGTITLTTGELAVDKNLTIAGPGAAVLSVSGNNASRVFSILDQSVSISGLTVRNGRVVGSSGGSGQPGFEGRGGGIYNQSTLWLSDCVISNNTASGGEGGSSTSEAAGNAGKGSGGGLCNIARLWASDCVISSNTATGGQGGQTVTGYAGFGGNGQGGGVYSAVDTLILSRCTLHGNITSGGAGGGATGGGSEGAGGQGYGGAVYNDALASLNACSVSGSAARGALDGAGKGSGSGSGGGLYNNGTLSLVNCTIANNSLAGSFNFGGGIYHQGSELTLRSCTVAGNSADYGGGLYSLGGAPDVGNTILAGNSARSGGPDGSGTIQSSDYNLVQNANDLTFTGTTTHLLTSVSPLLGALRNNGGPTLTMALLAGSPAIDKGKSFALTTDQRGRARPFDFPLVANAAGGDATDLGAFEVNPPILSIARAGANVLLSWSTNDSGYTLETKTNLNPPAAWASVPGSPAVVVDRFTVTNAATHSKFYRLSNP